MSTDPTAWSRIAREVIGTAYPWAPGHLVLGPDDTSVVPHERHPAFFGALDWHSCVHMQWSLVTLLSGYAGPLAVRERSAAVALLSERLTPERLGVEVDYLRARPGFERPYGWAWALQLVAAVDALTDGAGQVVGQRGELGSQGDDLRRAAGGWAQALRPLGELLRERVVGWLPRQAYPVRHGKHQNDAFALLLCLDAFERLDHGDAARVCRTRALDWFAADEAASTQDEPGGADFLSPALTEALLMTRVLPEEEVGRWLERFLPGLGDGVHAHLLVPPVVLDPADGQGAHLLGLALSRAWALRGLAPWLDEVAARRCREAAEEQESAVLTQITDGDFMATHWLVSFALLARGVLDRGAGGAGVMDRGGPGGGAAW